MPYIGVQPSTSFQTLAKQDFTTSTTTNYTLSQSVSSANDIALFINNVRQEPTYAYSASGTALTLTAATSSSDDMYCIYLGRSVGTINPASGSVGLGELSATGTKDATTFLRGDNSFATPSISGAYESALLHVQDQKSSGTEGGAASAGYQQRNLNTVLTNEISGASLSANRVTLPSGTYIVDAIAPAKVVNEHNVAWYNVTDASYTLIGMSAFSVSGGGYAQTTSTVFGKFTISAEKIFELRHYAQTARSTDGFGNATADSQAERYAEVKIWKVA